MIRKVTTYDAPEIAAIYNHYIRSSVATFEEEEVRTVTMARRIEKVQTAGMPWLVALKDGSVIGFAYASPWKERDAYRHSVEISVYVSKFHQSQGWGTRLYKELFYELKQRSVRVAIGGITLPNPASVAMHEKFGMQKVAHFEAVGYKFDQWLDVGYWQIVFDKQETGDSSDDEG